LCATFLIDSGRAIGALPASVDIEFDLRITRHFASCEVRPFGVAAGVSLSYPRDKIAAKVREQASRQPTLYTNEYREASQSISQCGLPPDLAFSFGVMTMLVCKNA
jgi:hypothetical protein